MANDPFSCRSGAAPADGLTLARVITNARGISQSAPPLQTLHIYCVSTELAVLDWYLRLPSVTLSRQMTDT